MYDNRNTHRQMAWPNFPIVCLTYTVLVNISRHGLLARQSLQLLLSILNAVQPRHTTLPVLQANTTTLTSSAPTIVRFNPNLGSPTLLNRLRPLIPGSVTLTASFGGSNATPLPLTAGGSSTAVRVLSMVLSATWCTSGSSNPQCPVTFAAVRNTSQVLQVRGSFCCRMSML